MPNTEKVQERVISKPISKPKADVPMPESDKKTLTPSYLMNHQNHFDPNVYTPQDLIRRGVLKPGGMKTDVIASKDGLTIPTMHRGGVVQRDGLHNLQKGEMVIAKDKVEKMKNAKGLLDGMAEAGEEKKEPAKEKEKGKEKAKGKHTTHRPREIHVKRAKGGFIANHDYDMPEDGSKMDAEMSQPHVIPDMAGLHAHMEEHMGEPEPGEAAEAAGAMKA